MSYGQVDQGQMTDYAVISSVTIFGNKKTKDKIVLREMDIAVGDTLLTKDISEALLRNKRFIFNTSLFQEVDINIKNWDTTNRTLELEILLREDWYIFPIPIFALADRNLNIWLKEFNGSLDRTSYGLRFYHFNATGNGDRVKVLGQFGYERRFELAYNRPNLNKAQTLGWNNIIRYQSRKEISFATEGNKQLFISDDNTDQFESFRYRSELTLRPRINQYHTAEFEFISSTVADTVIQFLNPDFYFGSSNNLQRYFRLNYTYLNDLRNFRTYPTKGSFYRLSISKEGLGIFGDVDLFTIDQTYLKYFEFSPKLSLEALGRMRYSIIRKQPPFSRYQGQGFGRNSIRGYELYVIDALDFGQISTSLRYQIVNKIFKFGRFVPIESFRTMPFQLLLTFNNDVGYANDPFYGDNNPLANRWLWGGGIGLDMMLYNDYVFQIEYNFNQLSESGLFLKVKLPF